MSIASSRVLARLFRRLFLERLAKVHKVSDLVLPGTHVALKTQARFKSYLASLSRTDWIVYAKPPFGGPEQVLSYLSRYTHRVAIANSRLVSCEADRIRFRYKNYRESGRQRFKTMTLEPTEFIRRFLQHVLPKGFRRIRHFGFFANGHRTQKITRIRCLLRKTNHHPEPEPNDESPAGTGGNCRDSTA